MSREKRERKKGLEKMRVFAGYSLSQSLTNLKALANNWPRFLKTNIFGIYHVRKFKIKKKSGDSFILN